MQIGQTVLRRPLTFRTAEEKNELPKRIPGQVVYIHPKGRFHTVAFSFPGGIIRESFLGIKA